MLISLSVVKSIRLGQVDELPYDDLIHVIGLKKLMLSTIQFIIFNYLLCYCTFIYECAHIYE
jgi:hypothetical protein